MSRSAPGTVVAGAEAGPEPASATRPRVSACVVARDAERSLDRCLASLAFADERIVIIDDRSRDASEEIARKAGARVIRRRYAGNIEQKNHALDLAESEWVLVLDADEALSPELRENLTDWLAHGSCDFVGAEFARLTFHLGRWIAHGDFFPDWQLRLFRRTQGRFGGANPHGRVRLAGRTARLEGALEHRSYADLSDQIERVREFSAIEAEVLWREQRGISGSDLALRPAARFLRGYLLKQGFRDGFAGFAVAVVSGFHVLFKYVSALELAQMNGEPEATRKHRRAR